MAEKIFNKIDKIKPVFDMVSLVLLQICKVFLVATIIVTSMMVLGRFVPFFPGFHWSEEIILTLMSYMALLSSALALRRGAHIRMVILDKYIPKKLVNISDIICDLGVLFVSYILITAGWTYAITIGGRGSYVALPWLSLIVRYFPICLGGFFMFIFGLEVLYNHTKAFFIKEVDEKSVDDAIVEKILKREGEIK